MKSDSFEIKLQDLASRFHHPDPTAAWKAEILERALTKAATLQTQALGPPSWLLAAWAAALIAAGLLRLSTIESLPPPSVQYQRSPVANAEPLSLLAFQNRLDQNNIEFP